MSGWAKRFLCLGGLVVAACAAPDELGQRHRPSHLTPPLPIADFAAYVGAAHQYIAAANQIADRPLAPAAVERRGPFELAPPARCRAGAATRAVLLIHDLGGSPYVMRDLGRRLAAACYLVRAVLLPGHGGVPGDLLTVDHRAWQEAVRRGVEGFAGRAQEVSLLGFGAGGTLALDYVLSGDPPDGVRITALVLLAPALGRPPSGLVARTQRFYRALAPKSGWRQVFPDDDPARYQSLPDNVDLQMARLTAGLAEQEEALALPVFMAIGADDATVDAAAARRWFCQRLAGPRALIWYTHEPEAATGCRFVTERTVRSEVILDVAHIGLPVAPDNPLYGKRSGYLSCLHYYWEQDTPSWFFCADPAKTARNSDIRYGEISAANLSAYVVRRLTYNPDFEHLAAAIVGFLDGADRSGRSERIGGGSADAK